MSDARDSNDALTPALRELGEQLRGAAQREQAAPRRRRGRGSRRSMAIAFAAITVSVGAATAADLISVGEPARDARDLPSFLRPRPQTSMPLLIARDPARKLPWAVAAYTSRDGLACVQFGQAQAGRLGELTNSVFHPYAADRPGICGHLPATPLV